MNWTMISGVGAFLCIRLVCHVILHAKFSRTDGERRRARQDSIERVQSEGKSARFLIYADKFEIWAEQHPYRFFAIQAAGTVLLAMAASPAIRIFRDQGGQAIQPSGQAIEPWSQAIIVGALVIAAITLWIVDSRKSNVSDARIAAAKLEARIEADE
jgi:hypothetical protein